MRSIQRETKIVDSKISDFPSRIQRGKIIQGRSSVSLSLNNLTLTLVEREREDLKRQDVNATSVIFAPFPESSSPVSPACATSN